MMKNTTNIYEQAADYQKGYEQALKDLSAQLKSDLPIAVHRDCSEIDYEIAYTLYGMRGKIDRAIAKLQRDLSFPKKEIVEKIREEFPKGARIALVEMDDPQAPPAGTEGTVVCVDDIGSLVVKWDNGSGLHVAYGKDKCKKIEKNSQLQTDDLIEKVIEETKKAVSKYGSDHVDAVLDEDTKMIYITYHDRHNSFPITGDLVSFKDVDVKKLEKELDKHDVGYCW